LKDIAGRGAPQAHTVPAGRSLEVGRSEIFLVVTSLFLVTGLDQHAGAVIAVATVVYVALTYLLVSEERRTRQLENAPSILVYLAPDERNRGALEIVVANVGRTTAREISFTNDADLDALQQQRAVLPDVLARTLPYLGPGLDIRSFFGATAPFNFPDFTVSVTYKNARGKKAPREEYVISMAPFMGTRWATGGTPDAQAARALRDIADRMREVIDPGTHRLRVRQLSERELADADRVEPPGQARITTRLRTVFQVFHRFLR
jgi:hypothetical protein